MHANVAATLAGCEGRFKLHQHSDYPLPIHSPADFAAQLGYQQERIAKTLLVRATDGRTHALVVGPTGKKTNFAAIAANLGVKRVEVASSTELANITGYPSRGVSPLGVAGLPVYLDESLLRFETILIGAGQEGVEIELSPLDLVQLTSATAF